MKILLLDIETLAHEMRGWGLRDQNIPLNMLKKDGEILCWSAKFLGEKKEHFSAMWDKGGTKPMLQKLWTLMNEADVVCGWNSKAFDVKWVFGQFLIHKLPPPSPFKQIDLMLVAKANFKLASFKLAFVLKKLGLAQKENAGGWETWEGCEAGDVRSKRTMEKYNRKDTRVLEPLYYRLLPWIKNHPNRNLYGDTNGCINCGADRLQRRGSSRTATGVFDRYQCQACGKWQRGEKQRAASNLMREAP